MSPSQFRLLPEAEAEANDAFDWYQAKRSGLGDDFRVQLKLALAQILSDPEQFAVVHGSNMRRARLRRFPYSIYFRSDVDSILVVAVFHEKRNPIIWKGRID